MMGQAQKVTRQKAPGAEQQATLTFYITSVLLDMQVRAPYRGNEQGSGGLDLQH